MATLRQLDHLVRVRQICTTLKLGSDAALALSRLRSDSPRADYRSAAEKALGSLQHDVGQAPPMHGELGQSEASWIVVDTVTLVAKSGGKARCRLTVKNFLGQPLEGITVTWETNLSSMDLSLPLVTDENGQVENDLLAGQDMGAAQVIARFGLDRQILAPLIVIDCDEIELHFKDPVHAPEEAMAGNLEVIEYRVQVLDKLGNAGRDRVVEWSTDLGTLERPQTRTDADGFASARLRSLSSGPALVIAGLPVNGEQHKYPAVTFLEQEYFQYVRFSGPVAVTQPTLAMARVVNLDGTPERRVTVLWSADTGSFVEGDRSITDDDGIAVIHYLSQEPGEVTLTVNAIYNNVHLLPLSSERTTIHELPRLVDMEPAQQYYSAYQVLPAMFRVRLEPAAAGYPVTWWDGEELLATTYTSADGSAGYQTRYTEEQLGEHTITVRSVRTDDQFDFKVNVVVPHTRLVAQSGPDSPGIVLAEAERWVFAVDPGLSSELQVFAERIDGVGDDEARLTFSLENYADPAALGVVFDPPLGETLFCDIDGKVSLKIDCTNAAFLANSDPHNNQIRLIATSNLGVSVDIWVGLRYLLDLEKSTLHFFRTENKAGLSGFLRRHNGTEPPVLREGQKTLRLTLDGANDPLDVRLFTHGEDVLGVFAPMFTGAPEQLGSSCSFTALGDLVKRVHFVGSNVFEADGIISDATMSLVADEDSGLLPHENGYVVDQGGIARCELQLSDADGPIAGVMLFAGMKINGIDCRADGPTDAQGRTFINIDTRSASAKATCVLPVGLVDFCRTLDMRVWEVAVTSMSAEWLGPVLFRVTSHFVRRDGRLFSYVNDNWDFTYFLHNVVRMSYTDAFPEGVTDETVLEKPYVMPSPLRLMLWAEVSEIVWLIGTTRIEISEDMTRGET